tara:strand:- start:28 stop:240 length:213 start_codon:yes stop_codon:yes gene_type:complete
MKPGDLVKIKEDYLLMGEETVGLVMRSYVSRISGYQLYEVQLLSALHKLGETHQRVERFYEEDLELFKKG